MKNISMDYISSGKFEYKENYNLSKLSSMKVGGIARIIVMPSSVGQLADLVRFLTEAGESFITVGGCTNILFATDLYDGVIISTRHLRGLSLCNDHIVAECGASLSSIMKFAKDLGYGGAEELSLIPGSVGAAVCGNSGAHGKEISDIVADVTLFRPFDAEIITLDREQMQFAYRSSIIKSGLDAVVLSCEIALGAIDPEESDLRRRSFLEARRALQPFDEPSLGSVFKRVCGVSAGYYIEKAGLKGYRIGGAAVSSKHAGFIVTSPGATWREVLCLIELIEARVFKCFGIDLEREITVIS